MKGHETQENAAPGGTGAADGSTGYATIEEAAAAIHAEHGNALVGLFYAGDMKRYFNMYLAVPVTEETIKNALKDAGVQLAIAFRIHASNNHSTDFSQNK